MHNVLKLKNMYPDRIYRSFLVKSYVLDYSESIDVHIEKECKKTVFAVRGQLCGYFCN